MLWAGCKTDFCLLSFVTSASCSVLHVYGLLYQRDLPCCFMPLRADRTGVSASLPVLHAWIWVARVSGDRAGCHYGDVFLSSRSAQSFFFLPQKTPLSQQPGIWLCHASGWMASLGACSVSTKSLPIMWSCPCWVTLSLRGKLMGISEEPSHCHPLSCSWFWFFFLYSINDCFNFKWKN